MRNFRSTKPALATLALAALIPTGVLAEDSDIKQLREQLRQLEQKILVLERRAELKDEAPQAYYYNGPFGLLAEYVDSSIEVRRGAGPVRKIGHTGYNLSAGWVFTGETSTYRGVTPRAAFKPGDGKWGAFEIIARLSGIDIDDAVFAGGAAARLVNPNVSASKLTAYGLGLNWHLSRSARVGLHFFHNEFGLAAGGSPAATALIADDENTFITHLQVAF